MISELNFFEHWRSLSTYCLHLLEFYSEHYQRFI